MPKSSTISTPGSSISDLHDSILTGIGLSSDNIAKSTSIANGTGCVAETPSTVFIVFKAF